MKLRVVEQHDGYGAFPLFTKGTAVDELKPNDEYPHWCSCVIEGHETFVADIYVIDGALTQDYNPTELIVNTGQTVTLIAIVFEWLYARDEKGGTGWLPASKVVSVMEGNE